MNTHSNRVEQDHFGVQLQKIIGLTKEVSDTWAERSNVEHLRSSAHILYNEVSSLLWSIESAYSDHMAKNKHNNKNYLSMCDQMANNPFFPTGTPFGNSPYQPYTQNIQHNTIHTHPNNKNIQIQNIQQNNSNNQGQKITQSSSASVGNKVVGGSSTSTTEIRSNSSPDNEKHSEKSSDSDDGSSQKEVNVLFTPEPTSPKNPETGTSPLQSDRSIDGVTNRKRRVRNGRLASNKKARVCDLCGTSKTPLWRTGPQYTTLCNACGLSYRKMDQQEEAKRETQRKVSIERLIN